MSKELPILKSKIVKMYLDRAETLKRVDDAESIQRFLGNYDDFRDVISAASKDLVCIYELVTRLSKTHESSLKETTLINVFMYLLLAEGLICNLLNFVSYVLVMTGHDLYTLTKRKYVKEEMEEIRKVEMSTKIQFLKHHGFGAVTKEYDSTFRNDIAHHNYRVDENGVLWVRGKRVNLISKTQPLMKIMEFVDETITEITKKMHILLNAKTKT